MMDDHTSLMRLEELADKLGIPIRYDKIKPEEDEIIISGGLCRMKGNLVIIINSRATTKSKIQVMLGALKHFDLSGVYVRPALRELLEEECYGLPPQNRSR
jgi:hypothetical protein